MNTQTLPRARHDETVAHAGPFNSILKRAFDLTFSMIALIVFSIPSACIAVVLIFKEGHPVFFRQPRVGKRKKIFSIIKFQTLVDGNPTATGSILRAAGLDEWPQFLNVLKGEMSIVGPRPLTQSDVDRLGWSDAHYTARWDVKPGITGLAQLYGGQHRKTSWFWDRYYLEHQNVFTDFAIVVLSFLVNVFGKTAIRRILFKQSNLK